MSAAWQWIMSGGWVYFAVGLFVVDRVLVHIPQVRANSVFEAFFNLVNPVLLRIPLVKLVAQYLDTPDEHADPPLTSLNRDLLRVLPFALASALAIAGCQVMTYCAEPQHAAEAKCVAANVAVDCGVPAIEQAALDVLRTAAGYLTGPSVDWGGLGQLEEQHGIGVVACAIMKLEALTSSAVAASVKAPDDIKAIVLANRDAVHLHAMEYMAARRVKLANP